MANPAFAAIERFHRNMQAIAVGARLLRNNRDWVVTHAKRYETSASLTLRCGQHTANVIVPICFTGPCLGDVGLRSVPPVAPKGQ